jgi:hypothetical protein
VQNSAKLLNVIIQHKAYTDALERITRFMALKDLRKDAVALVLLGPSGSGKSYLLEHIQALDPTYETDEGIYMPIVYVSVPSEPTIKNLAQEMLGVLDPHDRPTQYTEAQITMRIVTLLDECECDVIIFDEFQHFFDRTTEKVWHKAADWFKRLIEVRKKKNKTKRLLVVAGIDYGLNVIRSNKQLQRRFKGILKLPCFSWRNTTQRVEFIACLQAFAQATENFMTLPDLETEENQYRFYCATGGLIGHLKNLLSEVMLYADTSEKISVTWKDLDEAFERYLFANPEMQGVTYRPFSDTFNTVPTEANLTMAELIGDPPVQERKISRRRSTPGGISTFVAQGLEYSAQQ